MEKKGHLKHLLGRAQDTPDLVVPALFALVNGWWHKMKFLICGKRACIGKWFRVYGTFRIMGSGKVVLGDNCFIQSELFKPVSFLTVRPDATIFPAHPLSADRRLVKSRDVPAAPVRIERNVWVSTRAVILHGVTVGENSVVGACSLVRTDIPANSFYGGNPARFIKSISYSTEPTYGEPL